MSVDYEVVYFKSIQTLHFICIGSKYASVRSCFLSIHTFRKEKYIKWVIVKMDNILEGSSM